MDKIFSPIKERISIYIKNKGVTKESFFSSTGISASNFKGKGALSELGGDKIAKILTVYEDLNADWLLTGRGSMFKEETLKQPEEKSALHQASPDSDLYYKMYKEEKAENRELIEEIGALKQQVRTLKMENRALSQEVDDLRGKLKDIKGGYYTDEDEFKKEMTSLLSTGE